MSSTKEFIRAAKRASRRLKVVVPNSKGSYAFSLRAQYGADPQKRILMIASVDASSYLDAKTLVEEKLQATDIKLLRFVRMNGEGDPSRTVVAPYADSTYCAFVAAA
jgi:hypothetical protein